MISGALPDKYLFKLLNLIDRSDLTGRKSQVYRSLSLKDLTFQDKTKYSYKLEVHILTYFMFSAKSLHVVIF